MKVNELYYGFKLLSITNTNIPKAALHRFIHEKSGATLYFLDRKDENKSFSIGFNTPPSDDTGVFHILEHATLCGSQKFPVKEPFVELLKSSLYTFLNAMTYPDRTVYPVSSVNDKDFLNLIDVYMDAVLHPLAISDERIFMQEGWHYEPIFDEEEKVYGIQYNGVVYNEMKGAYSDPDTLNYSELSKALFPDTAYSHDSGGIPEAIPALTFSDFKAAHEKYYHPSNSCIVLDGSVDIPSVLSLIDSYLSDYEISTPPSHTVIQAPTGQITRRVRYEATEGEDLTDKGKLLVGYRSPDSSDREASLAMNLIADVLTGTNDSPLKKPLISSGLCGDVGFYTESSNLEDTFIFELRDVKDGQEEKLLLLLDDTLADIVKRGISKAKLKAALSYTEFKYKESDMGYAPAGLVFAMVIYSAHFYGKNPAEALDISPLFDSLSSKLGTDYFTETLNRFIISNNERAIIISTPSKTAAEETRAAEEEKLHAALEKMKAENKLQEYVDRFADFHRWQGRDNSEEALATIPKLKISDLTPPPVTETSVKTVGGVKVISHPLSTGGIIYLNLYFNLSDLNEKELALASFLSSVLTELPTKKYTAEALAGRIRTYLGGFYSTVTYLKKSTAEPIFKLSVSALERNGTMLNRIIGDILLDGVTPPKTVLKKLLQQSVSRHREYVNSEGMSVATLAASAPFSEGAVLADTTLGIGGYRITKSYLDDFEATGDLTANAIKDLAKKIFVKDRLTVSVTGKYDASLVKKICQSFPEGKMGKARKIKLKKAENQGIILPTKVSYAVTAGHLALAEGKRSSKRKIRITGGIAVARAILRLIYLWDEVRVKGGAYGSGLTMDRFGNFAFTSYRDPTPKKSLQVYRKAPEFLRQFVRDKKDLTEHIIGTAGKMYIPASPRQTGDSASADVLSGITQEYKQKLYGEILRVDYADVLTAAEILEKALTHSVCAIAGAKAELEASTDVLDTVKEF